LPQAALGHLGVVAREAEAGPYQLGLVESLRHQAAHREAVAGLLQHEGREHGQDLQAHAVAEFVDRLQQLRRLKPESFLRRAHAGLLVFVTAAIGGERIAHMMSAGIHASLLHTFFTTFRLNRLSQQGGIALEPTRSRTSLANGDDERPKKKSAFECARPPTARQLPTSARRLRHIPLQGS
jgi:hypothetical protein